MCVCDLACGVCVCGSLCSVFMQCVCVYVALMCVNM
jgi:hypothetical protein